MSRLRAVCRYLTVVTPDTRGKLLTRAEADGLSAARIGIVSVFEFDTKDALGGYHRGKEYAALAHIRRLLGGQAPVRGEPGQLRLADHSLVGGQLYPRAALYQTGFHKTYDVNLVETGDFGQRRVGWPPGDTRSGVTPVIPETSVWHKVKPGDTLAALASAYGTSVQAIAALNPDLIKDVNHVEVGWTIRIK